MITCSKCFMSLHVSWLQPHLQLVVRLSPHIITRLLRQWNTTQTYCSTLTLSYRLHDKINYYLSHAYLRSGRWRFISTLETLSKSKTESGIIYQNILAEHFFSFCTTIVITYQQQYYFDSITRVLSNNLSRILLRFCQTWLNK